MAIQLKDGGTYARANGVESTVRRRENYDFYPWVDQFGSYYTDNGRWFSHKTEHPFDLIRVVSEPSVTPVDPIAHMFEVVPEQRKFVGGEVFDYTYVNTCSVTGAHVVVTLGTDSVEFTCNQTHLLIAALQAAVDALESKD
jgi:hypothetical protein